ncbi:response regulator [Candidatus Saccharibacteria bacterium]|jgi:CheY-like chemotaxis protein|nr:response regulator [Candidatus Saccharibacteria bacterium]
MKMLNILLVDDDEWLADLYAQILEKEYSATVHRAASAQIVLDVCDEFTIDLIILDFFLPKHNALSILYELQSHEDLAQIPVIILSSIELGGFSKQLRELNVSEVFEKSKFPPTVFSKSIKSIMEKL